jgi:large subunit ribosomal protein L16
MKIKGIAKRGDQLAFGSFGIKAQEETWVTARQIEAARVAITRFMKREGQVWIRVFSLINQLLRKPAEVRMGKGKGAPEYWVAPVKPGRIIFEAEGVSIEVAKEALRLSSTKITNRYKIYREKRLRSRCSTKLN